MTNLSCPKCQNEPLERKSFYICEKCGKQWPIKNIIGLFCESRYWGEINQKEMSEVLDSFSSENYPKIKELMKDKYDVAYRFGFDPSRADWRFYLPIDKNWKILDAGCGMGGMTFPLAKIAGEVIAFDSSYERAKFVQLKSHCEGLDNIRTFVGDFDNLPLKDGDFDLIIFNGFLEWAGIPNEPKNPKEVQKDVLKRCLKLLKPGGYLYIGIENRIALNYFTTGRDHSGIRFTSLLPRFLANAYTKIRLKKPYRTYTYSKHGYEKLLKESGFENPEFLLPATGYNFPKYIIPYDNIYCLQYAVRNLISPNSWRKRLVKIFSNSALIMKIYRQLFFSFGIICKK
ncbi:MAG: methyltransferase domain-containing protein [Nanoarchaeota archaeon]|nr:methyltransferase domain-containing protein [Nanoarchaeota archaeon]